MQRFIKIGRTVKMLLALWLFWLVAIALWLVAYSVFARDYDPFGFYALEAAETTQAGTTPSTPSTPSRQVLFFCADWCGPCQRAKATLLPRLNAGGWRIGSNGHLRIVDADREPGMVAQYRITALPTFVVVHQGREVCRSGYQDKQTVERLYRQAGGVTYRRRKIQVRRKPEIKAAQ